MDNLPKNHFGVIAADPPWKFKARTALKMQNWNSPRHTDRHYATLDTSDICALPVGDLAAKDAHLFLWTTGPNLPQAFSVIDAWGFRYSGIAFNWVKLRSALSLVQFRITPSIEHDFHVGLGLTTRKNTELCLLARRGNARRLSKKVRELIIAPRREHSRKPDEFYERVQQYAAGPYLDLFARQQRPGWTAWGNEIDKFSGSTLAPDRVAFSEIWKEPFYKDAAE